MDIKLLLNSAESEPCETTNSTKWLEVLHQNNTQNGSPSTVQPISSPTKPSIFALAPVRFTQSPLLKDTRGRFDAIND